MPSVVEMTVLLTSNHIFFPLSVCVQLDALDVSTTFSPGACPQERNQGHR